MAEYKSNEPFYQLHFSELNEEAVKVLSFEGEENISRLFEYRLHLVSEDPELDAKSILNKKATFNMTRGGEEPIKLHGIISHFEQRGRTPEYVFYYAVLVPKMWRLTLTFQNEIYQNMDVEKLIKKVMETSGFAGEDYEIALNESYPEQEYTVQYQETNFNFLNRRLEHYGIFYYFDHRDDHDVIVFTDSNQNLAPIPTDDAIVYNPDKDQLSEKETISEITGREKVVTGRVRLKDYNYLHPEKQLLVESRIDADSPGLYYAFGDHFEDESQGEFLARVRNEELLATGKVFAGVSDCRLFRAGYKFKLAGHYREEWNDDYILISFTSRGTQSGLFSALPKPKAALPVYENHFAAMPATIAYRPARRTLVPRISGIMSAKIESGAGDEYAFIDEHGRYRAKMLFDISDRANGEATLPIRQVQAYSGSGYGMHFPNHADTELVWACVDGDVDRPVGLGTVPNPSNSSPSTSGNKAQSVIRTAGQNELHFDDTSGGENIYLHGTKDWTVDIVNDKEQTVGNNETLSVGSNRDKSVGSNQTEKIGANKTINVGGNHTEAISGNMAQTVNANKAETVAIAKALSIGAAYQVSVGAAMNETVGGGKMEQIGAFKLLMTGAKSIEIVGGSKNSIIRKSLSEKVLQTRNEVVGMAKNETVGIDKTETVGKDSIEKVGQNKKVEVKKDLDVTVGGKHNTTTSETFTLKAKEIILEASQKIEIKSGSSSIVIDASGITIKGAPLVNINP